MRNIIRKIAKKLSNYLPEARTLGYGTVTKNGILTVTEKTVEKLVFGDTEKEGEYNYWGGCIQLVEERNLCYCLWIVSWS